MSDNANVVGLPRWKKGATAEERFLELAQMAREDPDRFEHVVVGWYGWRDGVESFGHVTADCTAKDAVAVASMTLRLAQDHMLEP